MKAQSQGIPKVSEDPWCPVGTPGVSRLEVLADGPGLADRDVSVLERRDLEGRGQAREVGRGWRGGNWGTGTSVPA